MNRQPDEFEQLKMPTDISNSYISSLFSEMAVMLELAGENRFRVRAYERAARAVEGLAGEIKNIPGDKLLSVPGIGSGMYEHITDILKSGTFRELAEIKKKLPKGLIELISVQGIGPRRARHLYERLAIDSVEKLKTAAKTGEIRKLEGFGEKSEHNILSELANSRAIDQGRMIYRRAKILAADM